MKRAGMWLTWSGGTVFVVALVAFVLLIAATGMMTGLDDEDHVPVASADNSVDLYFEAGVEMQLWHTRPANLRFGPSPDCAVTGPSNVEPGQQGTSSHTVMNTTRESFASFRIVESGVYTISCDREGVTVAPPADFQGFFGNLMGAFAAFVGAMVGFLLLILGIILWAVGKNRTPRTPYPMAGSPVSGSQSL